MEVKDRAIIERDVDKQKTELIDKVEQLMKDSRIWEDDGLKESQFRNLMNVANSTTSVPVITNFIKYQIGRTNRPNIQWHYKNFGINLIKMIEEPLKT
ncbi:MAG: hypothetical protein ABRQ39_32240, partial [Candidatus Eremiobacterota bacterium]